MYLPKLVSMQVTSTPIYGKCQTPTLSECIIKLIIALKIKFKFSDGKVEYIYILIVWLRSGGGSGTTKTKVFYFSSIF